MRLFVFDTFVFLDALASLDFMLQVSQSVIDIFRISSKSSNTRDTRDTSDTNIFKIIKIIIRLIRLLIRL